MNGAWKHAPAFLAAVVLLLTAGVFCWSLGGELGHSPGHSASNSYARGVKMDQSGAERARLAAAPAAVESLPDRLLAVPLLPAGSVMPPVEPVSHSPQFRFPPIRA